MKDTTQSDWLSAAVDRFLGWKLPKDFAPDGGISFDGRTADALGYPQNWPIGTNLLTADQARGMLRHALGALGEQTDPPYGDKRKAAMAVYQPPFEFRYGYVFDSKGRMVADNGDVDGPKGAEAAVAARVRGWGRLGYMPNGAEIQDEIGKMMAEALNDYYVKVNSNF